MRSLVPLAALALALLPAPALAQAPRAPPQYRSTVSVDGARVKICYTLIDWAGKPVDLSLLPEHALFREDLATGRFAQLPRCEHDAAADRCCFVDECVPEGSYRYGLGCGRPVDTVKVGPVARPCERGEGIAPPNEWREKVNFGRCPRRPSPLRPEFAMVIVAGVIVTAIGGALLLLLLRKPRAP